MTPIEKMMDSVQWEEIEVDSDYVGGELPYSTHEGVLTIGGLKLRCYRLSNGQNIFNADDIAAFLG